MSKWTCLSCKEWFSQLNFPMSEEFLNQYVIFDGEQPITTLYSGKYAEQIVKEHNAHAKLVEKVDSLPKCWRKDENGKMIQDVPMALNRGVWIHRTDGTVCRGLCIVTTIFADHTVRLIDIFNGAVIGIFKSNQCYETYTAAEYAASINNDTVENRLVAFLNRPDIFVRQGLSGLIDDIVVHNRGDFEGRGSNVIEAAKAAMLDEQRFLSQGKIR